MEYRNLKRPRSESYDINWGEENEFNDDYETPQKRFKVDNNKSVFVDEKFVYTIGNEIHFTANINKISIQEIIRQMTNLIHEHKKKSDEEPEKLNIVYTVDSPGGSVTSILKFVDFITLAKKKYPFVEFTSIITGLTASAGTIMAIVADKRYMTKNAHAMIHELSSGNQGKYTELRSYCKFLDQLHEKLVTIYCDKTKKTKEEIEQLLKNETWFSADEYLKYGFVEEIK
jgi:ATP-dependent protease ClpP protease subunit